MLKASKAVEEAQAQFVSLFSNSPLNEAVTLVESWGWTVHFENETDCLTLSHDDDIVSFSRQVALAEPELLCHSALDLDFQAAAPYPNVGREIARIFRDRKRIANDPVKHRRLAVLLSRLLRDLYPEVADMLAARGAT